MIPFSAALRSSLGKKYIMGLTGLIWFGFVIGHLIGNYLLIGGREPFNGYAYFLESIGHHVLIYFVELFLLATLASHIWNGFYVAVVDKGRARSKGYAVRGNAGGASHKTIFSQNMIVTGLLLLVFLIFHIATMKYGVGSTAKPYTLHDGMSTQVRDLYQIVVDWFANPAIVLGYVLVMAMLTAHLSHGIWSAFQSLGLLDRGYYRSAVIGSRTISVLLGIGFMVLPVVIFLMQTRFQSDTGGLFQ